MATGVRKETTKGGLFQAYFTDYTGKRRYFTALTRSEARKDAKRLEAEHRLIRQGLRPPPSTTNKHLTRPFSEVKDEYLAWGESQGGRGGRPWGGTHLRNRRTHLAWWEERLDFERTYNPHNRRLLDRTLRIVNLFREMDAPTRMVA